MFYENFPKFLDAILISFSDDFNAEKSLEELTQIIFKEQIDKGHDLTKPDDNLKKLGDKMFTYPSYLIYALNFLQQEGLIIYDLTLRGNQKSIKITSKGFFKIKTESFSEKITNDKQLIFLQKVAVKIAIVSLFVSTFSVIISLYFSTNSKKNTSNNSVSKTSYNHNEKHLSVPKNVCDTLYTNQLKKLHNK